MSSFEIGKCPSQQELKLQLASVKKLKLENGFSQKEVKL
jgi:hypothetical protein